AADAGGVAEAVEQIVDQFVDIGALKDDERGAELLDAALGLFIHRANGLTFRTARTDGRPLAPVPGVGGDSLHDDIDEASDFDGLRACGGGISAVVKAAAAHGPKAAAPAAKAAAALRSGIGVCLLGFE